MGRAALISSRDYLYWVFTFKSKHNVRVIDWMKTQLLMAHSCVENPRIEVVDIRHVWDLIVVAVWRTFFSKFIKNNALVIINLQGSNTSGSLLNIWETTWVLIPRNCVHGCPLDSKFHYMVHTISIYILDVGFAIQLREDLFSVIMIITELRVRVLL